MNEFKGTKGKWSVSQPNGKSIIADADNVNGYEVVVKQDGFMSKYESKARANALLASKGPEMLEMLKTLHVVLDDAGKMDYVKKVEDLIKSATEL